MAIALCVYLFPNLFVLVLPPHIPCEVGELIVVLPQLFSVVLETIQILLSFETIYQRVMSAEYFYRNFPFIYVTYLVYLQDIDHGFMCKPDFSLLGKDQSNLI